MNTFIVHIKLRRLTYPSPLALSMGAKVEHEAFFMVQQKSGSTKDAFDTIMETHDFGDFEIIDIDYQELTDRCFQVAGDIRVTVKETHEQNLA